LNQAIEEQLLEFIKTHTFPSFYDIRKAGIIKNFGSLRNALDLLVNQKKIEFIEFSNRYYVRPLPDHLLIMGIIWKKADATYQHAINQIPRLPSFRNEFSIAYQESYIQGRTKIIIAKRVMQNLSERTSAIEEPSERCFLKAFVCLELKLAIWINEIKKRDDSNFSIISEQKLIDAVFYPMITFEDFFRNYDPKNPNYILGDSYEKVEELLDIIYFYDRKYFKALMYQENSFFEKISYGIDYFLKGNKKDAAICHHAKKRQKNNFNSRVKEKWKKITVDEIEQKFQPINGILTERMKAEKKNKDQKIKLQIDQKYSVLASKKRKEITNKITSKNQNKCQKELSRCVPKNVKNITNMIKTLLDSNENLNLPKLLVDQTAQTNRLWCETVDDYLLRRFLVLYSMRNGIKQFQEMNLIIKKLE